MRRFYGYCARGLGRLRGPDNSVGVQVVLSGGVGDGDAIRLPLAGPGNVTGLSPGTVRHVHPAPGSGDMRGGELPHLTIAPASLPWSMTPQVPQGARLQPWLGLLCLPRGDSVTLDTARQPLPVLTATDIGGRLPAPQSYALTTFVDDPSAGPGDAEPSSSAVARLLSPQFLEPDTAWIAALVPLYEAGALAGLGEDHQTAGSGFAWAAEDTAIRLPVYHAWRFSTGAGRGAEDMLRDLKPFALGAVPAHHPVADRFSDLAPGLRGGRAPVRSVLAAPGPKDPQPETALKDAFAHLTPGGALRLPIPSYGRVHAGGRAADAPDAPRWLAELNTDLSLRVLAGHGAALVRERQEELAAFVSEQAGALAQANAVLDRAQGAMRMAARLHAALPDPDTGIESQAALFGFAGPAAARLRLGGRAGGGSLASAARGHAEGIAMDPGLRAMAGQGGRLDDGARPQDTLPGAIRNAARTVSLADDFAGASGLTGLWDSIAQPARGPTIDRRDVEDARTLLALLRDPQPDGRNLPLGDDPRLREAWTDVLDAAESARMRPGRQPAPRGMPDAAAVARDVRRALDPAVSVPPRLRDRIGGLPDGALPARLLAEPVWPEPILDAIFARDPAILAPGIDDMPADAIIGLTYDARAMEAIMVGANHAVQAELRWRGIPTPFAVSPFRRAFTAPGDPGPSPARTDLVPLADWQDGSALGSHQDPRFDLGFVAIMRSELMVRYPGTVVMLARAIRADAASPREIQPNRDLNGRLNHLAPSLQGRLGRDLLYMGFPRIDGGTLEGSADPSDPDQGWFLVFRQDPSGTTFGLGASTGQRDGPFDPALRPWGELAWPDLTRPEIAADAFSGTGQGVSWGADSAQTGQILIERPTVVAIHLSDIITPSQGAE